MTRHILLYVLLCLCLCLDLLAQSDSILLKEIKVFGVAVETFESGAKTETVKLTSVYNGANLSTLGSGSSIFIRSYGNNMLASVSMRGTSASRTAVLWNGININSKTLGQSDFNLIPLATTDELKIHFGSVSSLYGSDAIGGSIAINSKPQWYSKPTISVRQSMGSFGTYNTTAKARISNKKIESVTSLYKNFSENNFEFKNTSKKGHPLERQKNASTRQYGVAQDLYLKPSKNSLLSINSWYTNNDRQIQPQMSAPNSEEHIADINTRLLGSYELNFKGNFIKAMLGWIKDDELYNSISSIITYQRIAGIEWNKKLSNHFTARAGTTSTRIKANVSSYESIVIEHRTDGFGSLKYNNNKVSSTINIRKTWVSGTKSPLTPSIGIDYRIHPLINIRSQLSKSYRVPTLNDKYWPVTNSTQGNPNVKSEAGHSVELGINLKKDFVNSKLELDIAVYKLWVNDWIIWLPVNGVIWKPENEDNVISKGIEVSSSFAHKIRAVNLQTDFNYNLNSVFEKADTPAEEDAFLPYNPKHLLNISTEVSYNKTTLKGTYNFTDKRYISIANIGHLDAYHIIGLLASYKTKNNKTGVSFEIRNLLNTVYQPQPGYAVPGRNYQLTLQFSI